MGLALDEPKKGQIQTFNKIEIMIDGETERYLQPSIIDCIGKDAKDCNLVIQPSYSTY